MTEMFDPMNLMAAGVVLKGLVYYLTGWAVTDLVLRFLVKRRRNRDEQ